MRTELVAGAVVAEYYRLDRQLGEGGMGVVWAAVHVVDGRRVALKLVRPDAAQDTATRRRLLREARAMTAVQHPSVVAIHDAIELDDGTPILVMDLLEGESLRDKLCREGRVPLPELARILLPAVSAVGTAHALGIVHRDLKPDNVFLVSPPGGAGRGVDVDVRVLDFGIAKLTAAEGAAARTGALTDQGALLGTPHYMSPEQILGAEDVDHRADIWSLGVILYECLTGLRPTDAESMGKVLKRILTGGIVPLREAAPDTPEDVCALVGRMLTPDRDARPQDLSEVSAVLERYGAITFRSFGAPGSQRHDLLADVAPAARAAADERRDGGEPASARATRRVDVNGVFATWRAGTPPSADAEAIARAGAGAGAGADARRRMRVLGAAILFVALLVLVGWFLRV